MVPVSTSPPASASPLGSTGSLFAISPASQKNGSTDGKNVFRPQSSFASGASSSNIFGVPTNSSSGFSPWPSNFQTNSEVGRTSLIFGVPNVPSRMPGSANTNAFQFSTTAGPSFPSFNLPSTAASKSLFGPQSTSPIGVPSAASFSFATPSVYSFTSDSASAGQSKLGTQSSAGSQWTIGEWGIGATAPNNGKGSSVAPYSETLDIDGSNQWKSLVKLQSISAMPVYRDKSHEEIRMEDYGLFDKGRNTTPGGQSNLSFDARKVNPLLNPSKSNPSPEFTKPVNIFPSVPCPPQSQSFQPQGAITSSLSAFTPTPNQFSPFNPFTKSASSTYSHFHPSSIASTSSSFSISSSSKQPFTSSPALQFSFDSQNATDFPKPVATQATNLFFSSNPLMLSDQAKDCKFVPVSNTFESSPFSSLSSCTPSLKFSPCTQYAFQPQNTVTSSMPPQAINPFSFSSSSQSLMFNNKQLSPLSAASISLPLQAILPSKPSTLSLFPEFATPTVLGPQPSFLNGSQSGQLASMSCLPTSNMNHPSQAPCRMSETKEAVSQNINEQLVVRNPFGPRTEVSISSCRPDSGSFKHTGISSLTDSGSSKQSGISILTVANNLSPTRRGPLLRLRHSSLRHYRLSTQRYKSVSSEPRVPFFIGMEDSPCTVDPLLPRMNPRSWVLNPFSGKDNAPLHTETKFCGEKVYDTSSPQLVENAKGTNGIPEPEEDFPAIADLCLDDSLKQHELVLSLMPKLGHADYYTEPPIDLLVEKEKLEPGFCSHVPNFVVGRQGYGSIMFLGDTDVRHHDLESIIQFNNREVIVYADTRQKPPVGQCLNKPAEVTLLNVKCISKKTGTEYTSGIHVQKYKQILIKKSEEQGAKFISYDPVQGEWKFRVQHF